jgi:hypothetical protein
MEAWGRATVLLLAIAGLVVAYALATDWLLPILLR